MKATIAKHLIALAFLVAPAAADAGLRKGVAGSGGNLTAGELWGIKGTVGQVAVGRSFGPNSAVGSGFWSDHRLTGLSVNIFDMFSDAFPVNSQNKPTFFGPVFDTLAAQVRTGLNIAPPGVGISGPNARNNIPGDTATVAAPGGDVRLDLVFRILPGVGNYVTIGTRASGVARRPDTVPRVAASTSDPGNGALGAVDKFWGSYLADNGAVGTDGNGTIGPGHPLGVWDLNRWNSARCDTAEINFFPIDGLFPNGLVARLTPGRYMSSYHESDPKYTILGIAKNRCFLNKNKQPVNLTSQNINCGNLGGALYPPSFYGALSGLAP